ncbi:hypothetical protein P9112_011891 [Eukaryota sp. TZLM1-RC]
MSPLHLFCFSLFVTHLFAREALVGKDVQKSFNLRKDSSSDIIFGLDSSGSASVHCEFDGNSNNMVLVMNDRSDMRFSFHNCDSLPSEYGRLSVSGKTVDNVFFNFPSDGMKQITIMNCGQGDRTRGTCRYTLRNPTGYFSLSFEGSLFIHSAFLIAFTFLLILHVGGRFIRNARDITSFDRYLTRTLLFTYIAAWVSQTYLHHANGTGNGLGFFLFFTALGFGILVGGTLSLLLGIYFSDIDDDLARDQDVIFKSKILTVIVSTIIGIIISFSFLFFFIGNIVVDSIIFGITFFIVGYFFNLSSDYFPTSGALSRFNLTFIPTKSHVLNKVSRKLKLFCTLFGIFFCFYSIARLIISPLNEPVFSLLTVYLFHFIFIFLLVINFSEGVFRTSLPEPEQMTSISEDPVKE